MTLKRIVMKTNELLLLTAGVTVIQFSIFGQFKTSDTISIGGKTQLNPNTFKQFTGGVNALYNGTETKGGIDLAVQTYHYYLVTGKAKIDTSTINKKNLSFSEQYRGFEFFLLNRAAVNFDTSGTMASDYLSSLQASPLTIRFVKEIFLTKQRNITSSSYSPVVSIKLTGDSRIVPYNVRTGQINVGTSGNLFVTFSSQFTRLEFNQQGKEIDRGTMYIQPSVGIAIGNSALMKSVMNDPQDKVMLASECRLGFKSHSKTINDCCLLLRYGLNEFLGPKFRAGLILSSIN